jgi:hypothetical protein
MNPDRAADAPAAVSGHPRVCPFLRHPFPDCYCMNISGAKIPRMVEYCAGNYRACQVYRRWLKQRSAVHQEPAPTPGQRTDTAKINDEPFHPESGVEP